MQEISHRIKKRQRHQPVSSGQGLVEYALILGLAALVVIAIVQLVGPAIEETFLRFVNRAPSAPPSLVNYTPPPTYTSVPTVDPGATNTLVPSPTNTITPTNTVPPSSTPTNTPTATATPSCAGYGPYTVPGTVQMEAFACGGSNRAFVDSTGDGGPGSGAYRQDVTTQGPDLGSITGGYYLGWLVPNEWVVYNINAVSSRVYDLTFRVASANNNGRFRIEVWNNNSLVFTSPSVAVANTGGNQAWANLSVPQIPIIGGQNQIRLVFESGNFNLDYFNFAYSAIPPTATSTLAPTNTPTATPTNTPTAVPTTVVTTLINANFNTNADNFVYQDDTFGTNNGSRAYGVREGNIGNGGTGGLRVTLSEGDRSSSGMSGGWSRTFLLNSASPVSVTFDYRLVARNTESSQDECGQVLVKIDSTLYGSSGNSYVREVCGESDTNWNTFTFNSASLPAGAHTITIGGYLSNTNNNNEDANVYIDNVLVETN